MNFLQSLTKIIKRNTQTTSSAGCPAVPKIPFWRIGLCLGILFCILGYLDGQFTDIMKKAVMICLECIGIG